MPPYTKKDGEKLLKLARQSIEEEFSGKKPSLLQKLTQEKFNEKKGVFVTLYKKFGDKKELRGCIGFPYPTYPLKEAIYKASKEAAFNDFRFFPLKKEELKNVRIEISILSLPKPCKPDEIVIGRDGLICNYQGFSGLLLPQVAEEYNMNKKQFLEALCEKAGLPSHLWKNKDFKLWRFSCQIFKEKDL